MNDTVGRIVDLMFQDVVMNEETQAIYDETMSNCQERYQDMISRGVTPDDAISAVIESLKGMEEVINQYPKKEPVAEKPQTMNEVEVNEDGEYVFDASAMQEIDVTLVCEDVKVKASEDDRVHVLVKGDEEDHIIQVGIENGRLKINRANGKRETIFDSDHFHFEGESISGIGRMIGKMFNNVRVVIQSAEDVTIRLPDHFGKPLNILTTSGDVSIEDVELPSLRAVSTNGDVTVHLDEGCKLQNAEIITTSGDMEATLFAETATLTTTSGDLEIEGRFRKLMTNSVSGDIDVHADAEEYKFRSVSGDVDVEFGSDCLRQVNGSTISGDVDIQLPAGLGSIAIKTRTISGFVTTHYHSNGIGPTVAGAMTTTSGNIDIR